MKTYTVREIADMLNTNPETVRRWIRLGKLEAVQQSRKEGNVVTEQSLKKFLKSTPKYKGMYATGIAAIGLSGIPIIGLPLATATVLSRMLIQKKLAETVDDNTQVSVPEIKELIEISIKNSEKKIAKKEEEIKNIQQDISDEKEVIEELEKILMNIDSNCKGE